MRRTVAVVLRSIALSMSLENVIHHRETQTAHEFVVEHQLTLHHTVAQTVEVFKDARCLFFRQRNNRVLIQGDTAPDAIIV